MEKIIELLPINNVRNISVLAGGDVNDTYKLDADGGSYFLKVHKNKDASFFECEKAGLKLFEENGIFAPRALSSGDVDGSA
ncbi:fructosamine kinase family protein, partial [uncultured Anaerococcus sp.]|uniref:fructosamine kinase family protein n=1 Tax=uncultured Anaerococcus sp. TaxID=293428 RepID=UPI0028897944